MLQLDNQTPFACIFAVLPNREGIDTMFVVVKATVNLRPKIALAPKQIPPSLVDEYYEAPENSSLKSVSEMHIGKPGTDILLVGCARTPDGQPDEGVLVSMSVAERSKQVLVMGDRTWQSNGTPTAPEPFSAIPLVWERAFGGMHTLEDRIYAEERNPIGVGFRGKREPEAMQGLPVPNLEDPAALMASWNDAPPPACFAPIAPSWQPRRAFAGTYDLRWQRQRAPYLPSDFDPRFFQTTSGAMCFDRYLVGAEQVQISGASEDRPIDFTVPTVRPIIEITLAGQFKQPEANLETLQFEPDQNRVSLTWRASQPCDRQALKVEKIVLRLRQSGTSTQ
jgi:hypothetical protein